MPDNGSSSAVVFLAFTNIAEAIRHHLDTRSVMIEPGTRLLLSELREVSEAHAAMMRERVMGDREGAGEDAPGAEEP